MINTLKDITDKLKFTGVIIAVISFVFIALFSFTELYDTFELRLYDMRFRIKPSVPEWDQLVYLDIDDNSIVNIGKYPWPRHYYSSALNVLKEVGARQVTFDMEFPNPSPAQINANVLNQIRVKSEKKKQISSGEINSIIINNDDIFAEGVRNFKKVIIPYHFQKDAVKNFDMNREYLAELQKAEKYFTDSASIAVPEIKRKDYESFANMEIVDIARPIPALINAAYRFGYTDSDFDSDGIARKKQLIKYFGNRVYFEMGLVMLMDACNVKKEDVVINPGESIILKNAYNPLTFSKQDIVIPIDEKGRLYINWAGPGSYIKSFRHVPFYALLEYPLIKKEIHDYFNEKDAESGSKGRAVLLGELDDLYEKFDNIENADLKRKASKRISEIRKKISEIEKGYASEIGKEIEKAEKEYKKTKSDDLKVTIEQLQNYLTGINIVISVEDLKDKICLAGLVATGTQDLGATPTDNEYWMVGTYHNIVNTILNDAYIVKVNKFVNLLLIFIFAVAVGIIINRLGARISLIAIVAALVIINVINIVLFAFYNIWFDQLGTNLAAFIPSAVIAGMKLMKEESQKRYIKNAFSRYLAPAVIEKIIESPKALELGGEVQNISIFFSDIAKFSTISEKLSPPQLVELLNEYLSEMTNIILSYGGTVDKYIGDAIMAFYGAPLPYEDHAKRCCMAAIDMKRRLKELQEIWRERKTDILKVRMGMNTGKAVVGNMGSNTQMGYTAMGDSVNLASRLEGVNKAYDTYAIISGSTYEHVKEIVDVRKLDTIQVVGKEEPIEIFELLGEKGKLPDKIYDMLEKYYKGLKSFSSRDWKGAITYFRQGLKIVDDDGPSQIYIERCEKYIRKPPSKSWDGVNKMTSK